MPGSQSNPWIPRSLDQKNTDGSYRGVLHGGGPSVPKPSTRSDLEWLGANSPCRQRCLQLLHVRLLPFHVLQRSQNPMFLFLLPHVYAAFKKTNLHQVAQVPPGPAEAGHPLTRPGGRRHASAPPAALPLSPPPGPQAALFNHALWLKNTYQNGPSVNGTKDQNLHKPHPFSKIRNQERPPGHGLHNLWRSHFGRG